VLELGRGRGGPVVCEEDVPAVRCGLVTGEGRRGKASRAGTDSTRGGECESVKISTPAPKGARGSVVIKGGARNCQSAGAARVPRGRRRVANTAAACCARVRLSY